MRISGMLSEFERALAGFDKRQIEEARSQIEDALKILDGPGVFD